MKPREMPIMPAMCATCPFRPGSVAADLQSTLAVSALTEASRICHSTGGNGTIVPKSKNVSKKPLLCRGARDHQLNFFHRIGFLPEPTDEAWQKKREELGC